MTRMMIVLSALIAGINVSSWTSAQDMSARVEGKSPAVSAPAASRTGAIDLSVENSVPDAWMKSMAITLYPEQGARVDGTADVLGFPNLNSGSWGRMDWKVSGSNVTGTLYKTDGTIEGTFDGRLSRTGLSGKFVHADGRVGMWSWKGPPPR